MAPPPQRSAARPVRVLGRCSAACVSSSSNSVVWRSMPKRCERPGPTRGGEATGVGAVPQDDRQGVGQGCRDRRARRADRSRRAPRPRAGHPPRSRPLAGRPAPLPLPPARTARGSATAPRPPTPAHTPRSRRPRRPRPTRRPDRRSASSAASSITGARSMPSPTTSTSRSGNSATSRAEARDPDVVPLLGGHPPDEEHARRSGGSGAGCTRAVSMPLRITRVRGATSGAAAAPGPSSTASTR